MGESADETIALIKQMAVDIRRWGQSAFAASC
jgi:hypothetical protein